MGLLFGLATSYFRFAILVAVIPAIVLMILIYRQDRIESEPMGLLLKLFFLGGLTTIGAGLLENLCVAFLSVVYPNEYSVLYQFILYFAIVALIEEGGKYLVLRTTWNHPAFNFRFDAVVYGAFASLGFAAFENISYVFSLGVGVAPVRAFTAIPLHCVCGVFMGHFYGMAKACERYQMRAQKTQYHLLSFLIPLLIHGFYDFAATSEIGALQLAFVVFVIAVDIVAIVSVKRYARQDMPV